MGIREELQKKRLELGIMEADVRVEDLKAEIEKVLAKKADTEAALKEINNQ